MDEGSNHLPHKLQPNPVMLVMGLHPPDFREDRQGDVHGLDRQVDPDHLPDLEGGFGLDPQPQGADVEYLADFKYGHVFAGEKPAPFQLKGLLEGLAGYETVFLFRVHGFPSWGVHRKNAKGVKRKPKIL
jgi:hypothetical protein